MFCRECGSKIEDGARSCVNCGAEVRVNNNGEQSFIIEEMEVFKISP